MAGPLPDHRVQHVHRARDRHGHVYVAPEGRGSKRVLALVPVRPRSGGSPVPSR
jgi:hypothetical protein